jgi:hypothetical protein
MGAWLTPASLHRLVDSLLVDSALHGEASGLGSAVDAYVAAVGKGLPVERTQAVLDTLFAAAAVDAAAAAASAAATATATEEEEEEANTDSDAAEGADTTPTNYAKLVALRSSSMVGPEGALLLAAMADAHPIPVPVAWDPVVVEDADGDADADADAGADAQAEAEEKK